ncbi:uncharacterized protein LOC127750861 [Frankliniella occidentalis]|uniref:Uncharacterized protein LOC127750861 n=1 Tax=Frankliniella occidentalis TaxID=133901 RepID=A0A9C6X5B1_FRAOC|nr:uncharacterized protein LOC127750861 [Frankliniella occidentalis]
MSEETSIAFSKGLLRCLPRFSEIYLLVYHDLPESYFCLFVTGKQEVCEAKLGKYIETGEATGVDTDWSTTDGPQAQQESLSNRLRKSISNAVRIEVNEDRSGSVSESDSDHELDHDRSEDVEELQLEEDPLGNGGGENGLGGDFETSLNSLNNGRVLSSQTPRNSLVNGGVLNSQTPRNS